ncbi:MAG: hypothetical protein WBW14_01925 [Candidatus Acidiferrum sp.]
MNYLPINKLGAPHYHDCSWLGANLMDDEAAARKSYEEFLSLWKDADSDIPIYQQAKGECAGLHASF